MSPIAEPRGAVETTRRDFSDWRLVALVGVGGAIGTALRLGVSAVVPVEDEVPLAVIIVNLSGAFVLGWLLEALALRGPETAVGRSVRLGVGTGVLGGYTTYSALAVGTDGLIDTGHVTLGLLLAVPTVLSGALLAWAGAGTARAITRGAGER